jgi:hypothetical protein
MKDAVETLNPPTVPASARDLALNASFRAFNVWNEAFKALEAGR